MKAYSDEELKRAVYYPGCGTDFIRPILAFSHVSNLFIYVDLKKCCWSEPKTELIERLKLQKNEARDPANVNPEDPMNIFQPINMEEYIQNVQANERLDWGVKGKISEKLQEFNQQLAPDWVKLIGDGKPIAFSDIGMDEQPKFPPRFKMAPDEQQRYEEMIAARRQTSFEPWAKEVVLRRKIGTHKRDLKLIYITGECFATYSALFHSDEIAPTVFVTTATGIGPNFAQLEDPEGITGRFLRACKKHPQLWIRYSGNSENSLYNTSVQEYMCWNRPQAFISNAQEFKLDETVELEDKRKLTLRHEKLCPPNVENFDFAFRNPRGSDTLKEHWPKDKTKVFPQKLMSLPRILDWVDSFCQQQGYKSVIMMPRGYEDEGVIFQDWICKESLPERLEVRFTGEFDFADLRGFV